MLSRVANSLFWMARYMERADNLARLIQAHRHTLMDAAWTGDDTAGSWNALLEVTSLDERFAEALEETDDLTIDQFLTISPVNQESILCCVAAARENARSVRDQISEEMWLKLNGLQLQLKESGEEEWRTQPAAFCERILDSSLMFQGISHATIPRGEAWAFIQLGKFMERADKTSRILDIPHFLPESQKKTIWPTVLAACSARSAYRERYRGEIDAENVTAVLVFSSTFPRSIRFCCRRVAELLHQISGRPAHRYGNEAERLAGALLARLDFAGRGEVIELGLHDYVDSLQEDLNQIGLEIFTTYFRIREIGEDALNTSSRQRQRQPIQLQS